MHRFGFRPDGEIEVREELVDMEKEIWQIGWGSSRGSGKDGPIAYVFRHRGEDGGTYKMAKAFYVDIGQA